MTAEDFRRLALAIEGAEERAHQRHPDFRANGKVFATLGYPTGEYAMVKLTPEQQEMFVRLAPEAFVPVKGSWGAKGATNVVLGKAKKTIVKEALLVAYRSVTSAKGRGKASP